MMLKEHITHVVTVTVQDLLEYHMTPIRHQGAESSPMRLMQQRTIRGILPTRQQETNQCNYEKFRTRS